MSRTKFMGIFLVILGVISVVVGIIRGDMTSSAAMFSVLLRISGKGLEASTAMGVSTG